MQAAKRKARFENKCGLKEKKNVFFFVLFVQILLNNTKWTENWQCMRWYCVEHYHISFGMTWFLAEHCIVTTLCVVECAVKIIMTQTAKCEWKERLKNKREERKHRTRRKNREIGGKRRRIWWRKKTEQTTANISILAIR